MDSDSVSPLFKKDALIPPPVYSLYVNKVQDATNYIYSMF